jgi:hypothetical protein
VDLPVRIGLELVAQKPAVLFGELGGLFDHPGSLSGLGGYDDLGNDHPHQLAALDAKGLGHSDDALVAPLGAHHGDRDSGVSRGRLDDRVAGIELALLLGHLDDGEGQPIFDARQRVRELGLGVDGHSRVSRQFVAKLDHGGVSDHLANVLEWSSVSLSAGLGRNFTAVETALDGSLDAAKEKCLCVACLKGSVRASGDGRDWYAEEGIGCASACQAECQDHCGGVEEFHGSFDVNDSLHVTCSWY